VAGGARGVYAVVRGPLGVGKTTIARALADALGGRVISIDQILERHDLEEWEAGYISVHSFLRTNDFAIAEAEPLLNTGVAPIVDGNFYHRAVLEDLVKRLVAPHLVFSLKAPLSVCLARDRDRANSFGEEAVREVFTKVAEVDYGVDVDACRPVEEIVWELVRRLREEARHSPPQP